MKTFFQLYTILFIPTSFIFKVPTPLKENRRRFLAMKWLIEAANTKDPTIPFYQQLADELLNAHQNTVSGFLSMGLKASVNCPYVIPHEQ